MKKYTLLANRYRGKKPPAMQAREADAWREMLEKGEVTKDDLVELARDAEQARGRASRSEQTQKEYSTPSALSARSAGMIPSTYRSTTYVLDPAKGENDIQQSELPPPTKSALVRQIREDRAKLEADEISPTAAERRARESKSARSWGLDPSNGYKSTQNAPYFRHLPARTYDIRQIYP